jgi:GIY-YIG catalytic domain
MPIKRSNTARSIYALIDPRDNTIRYVGCAVDIEKRLAEHLRDKNNTPKCRWLAELKRNGLLPELEILEVVDGFYGAFSREDYWINTMVAAGAPLTNSLPMQGVFAKQKTTLLTPNISRGTKLRTLRKRLRVRKEEVVYRAGVSISAYNRAEGGYPVNYGVAMDILDAINSLLVEFGKSEVSMEDLDWTAE